MNPKVKKQLEGILDSHIVGGDSRYSDTLFVNVHFRKEGKTMKNYISKIIALVCVLSIMLTFATPAFAAEARANGISYGTVRINSKDYDAQFYVGGSYTSGGYSRFYTAARCVRVHHEVMAEFDTAEAGYQKYYSTKRTWDNQQTHLGVTGTSESNRATYKGDDTVIGLRRVSANLEATTYSKDSEGNDTDDAVFNFYASTN